MTPRKHRTPNIPKEAKLPHKPVSKGLMTFFLVAKSSVKYSLRQWIVVSKEGPKRVE